MKILTIWYFYSSCGDKMHGAPGWETGLFCPILAVPLGIALHIPEVTSSVVMYV
jgi:hypothetical protein